MPADSFCGHSCSAPMSFSPQGSSPTVEVFRVSVVSRESPVCAQSFAPACHSDWRTERSDSFCESPESVDTLFDTIDNEYSSRSSTCTTNSLSRPGSLSTSPSFCNAYGKRRRSSLRMPLRSVSFCGEESIFEGSLMVLSQDTDSHPLSNPNKFDNTAAHCEEVEPICPKPSNTPQTSTSAKNPRDNFVNLERFLELVREIRATTLKNHTFNVMDDRDASLKLALEAPLETFDNRCAELYVFDEACPTEANVMTMALGGKARRMREERTNPAYLHHYAVIQSMQNSHVSHISEEEIEVFDQFLMDHQALMEAGATDPDYFATELQQRLSACWGWRCRSPWDDCQSVSMDYVIELKFMSLARHKLWTTMTLPPREDGLPSLSAVFDDITPAAPPAAAKSVRPWMSMRDVPARPRVAGFGVNGRITTQFVSTTARSKKYVSSPLAN